MSSAIARSGGACGGPVTVICSSPFSRSDAFAAVWFTSTSPFSMSCCTRARLTSASLTSESCVARYWSRRCPAPLSETTRVMGNSGMERKLNVVLRRYFLRHTALQPPDHSTADHQQDRNQLRSRHQPAEDFSASGIVAQELDEVTLNSVKDHEAAKHLPIEPLALEQPDQQQKIEELGSGFDQLCRFNPDTERSSTDRIRQRIRKDHAPEVIGRFAVTAPCRETTEAPKDVSKGKPRRDGVGGPQRRHPVTPHVPRSREQRGNQSTGKYASSLQRIKAENLAPVVRVSAPVVDDVKHLRPNNSREHNQNPKIPRIVSIDTLLLRIVHGHPEPNQHA